MIYKYVFICFLCVSHICRAEALIGLNKFGREVYLIPYAGIFIQDKDVYGHTIWPEGHAYCIGI